MVKNGQDYDWTIFLDETKEVFKTLFLIGPKAVQESRDILCLKQGFPLVFLKFRSPSLSGECFAHGRGNKVR